MLIVFISSAIYGIKPNIQNLNKYDYVEGEYDPRCWFFTPDLFFENGKKVGAWLDYNHKSDNSADTMTFRMVELRNTKIGNNLSEILSRIYDRYYGKEFLAYSMIVQTDSNSLILKISNATPEFVKDLDKSKAKMLRIEDVYGVTDFLIQSDGKKKSLDFIKNTFKLKRDSASEIIKHVALPDSIKTAVNGGLLNCYWYLFIVNDNVIDTIEIQNPHRHYLNPIYIANRNRIKKLYDID